VAVAKGCLQPTASSPPPPFLYLRKGPVSNIHATVVDHALPYSMQVLPSS
jgi:hypothetical protein